MNHLRFMRLFHLFLLLLLPVSSRVMAQARPQTTAKEPRILILLDGSSSMLQPWAGNDSRFKAAGRLITDLMDSIYALNDEVEFSLRVYGHQFPAQENNCFDTRREVRFTKDNRAQMTLRLNDIQPNGVSPIAYSLKEAAEQDLVNEQQYAYSIILITDGGESCKGDICDVVRTLLDRKIFFRPYILSMVDYAPLRQQYECLGTYLQVAVQNDFPPAIARITEAYRKAFQLPGIVSGVSAAPVQAPRPVQVRNVPPPAREPVKRDTVAVTPPARKDTVAVKPPPPPKQDTVIPKTVFSSPVVLPKDTIRPLPLRKNKSRFPVAAPAVKLSKVTPRTFKILIEEEPAPVASVPAAPKTPVQPTRAVPQPASAPPPQTSRQTEPAPFTVQTEEARETTMEVFFTDGKGTFYKSTPQLQLVETKTGKPVQKFYRTVDAAGNPDLQQVTPGTYDIILTAKGKILSSGIVVADQKKNKVIIKVSIGSLRFAYDGNAARPVKEFEAIVTRRFDNLGPSIRQRCSAELDYAPGNYYVEVNTLPITRYNLDIDFGTTTELKLPEPGFVQFTNTNAVGRVTLYVPMGDQYVSFYALDVNGNPAAQQVQLKPGTYEAHYTRANVPYARETVVKFLVKSNAITDVELQ